MNQSMKILIIDDEQDHRETYRMILEGKGYHVAEAADGYQALAMLEAEYFPIVLSDMTMPGMDGMILLAEIKGLYRERVEVIMVTGYGSVETAVEAMKIGAFGYFIKTRSPEELLAEIEKARKLLLLRMENNYLKENQNLSRYLLESQSPAMQEVLHVAKTVASSRANVLLLGESGVGKEVIAELIHQNSGRASMPFVAINCRFFSDSLMESELFGHEKGAFTGALGRRIGRFEEAHGGTVFLDEVGEIATSTQVKLLRVLENRQVERIGANKPLAVDFRLINATNRDLQEAIEDGSFREDLYYRINTITLKIPPLRERREDLPAMIEFFIDRYATELKKEIKGVRPESMDYLLNYHYPGNIRELKNIIERMAVMTQDGWLGFESSQSNFLYRPEPQLVNGIEKGIRQNDQLEHLSYKDAKLAFEEEYIREMLNYTGHNITKAASLMDISRRQLFNKITELGIKKEDLE